MLTDYRRYTKMLGDTPRSVERGTAHAFLVKTKSVVWPAIGSTVGTVIVMGFDKQGKYLAQWVEEDPDGE